MARNEVYKHDLYALLGVSEKAKDAEIKRSYRSLCLKMHPDKAGNTQENNERFALLQEAWEVLRDPIRRATYNNYWFRYHCKSKAGKRNYYTSNMPTGGLFSCNPVWTDFFWQDPETTAKKPISPEMDYELAMKYNRETADNINKINSNMDYLDKLTTLTGTKPRPADFWKPLARNVKRTNTDLMLQQVELKVQIANSQNGITSVWAIMLMDESRLIRGDTEHRLFASNVVVQALTEARNCSAEEAEKKEALVQKVEKYLRVWGKEVYWKVKKDQK